MTSRKLPKGKGKPTKGRSRSVAETAEGNHVGFWGEVASRKKTNREQERSRWSDRSEKPSKFWTATQTSRRTSSKLSILQQRDGDRRKDSEVPFQSRPADLRCPASLPMKVPTTFIKRHVFSGISTQDAEAYCLWFPNSQTLWLFWPEFVRILDRSAGTCRGSIRISRRNSLNRASRRSRSAR